MAVFVGDFASAVKLSLKANQNAEALILAHCGGSALLRETQEKIIAKSKLPYLRVVSSVLHKDLSDIVQNADIKDWKAILAIICTFSKADEFEALCDQLGVRLANVGIHDAAIFAYICAGNVGKTAEQWLVKERVVVSSLKDAHDKAQVLQSFVEKVVTLKAAVGKGSSSYAK